MPRGNRIYSMSTGTFSLYVLFCYVDVIFFNKNQFYLCERNTFTQNYVIMWVNYLTSLSLSISFQQSLMRFQWVNKSKVLDRKLGNREKAQEMLNVTHRSCSLSLLWWSLTSRVLWWHRCMVLVYIVPNSRTDHNSWKLPNQRFLSKWIHYKSNTNWAAL